MKKSTEHTEWKIHRLAQMNTDFSDLSENPKTTDYTDFRFVWIFLDKPKNPHPHTMKDIPTFSTQKKQKVGAEESRTT
jgi:hypothetical protein